MCAQEHKNQSYRARVVSWTATRVVEVGVLNIYKIWLKEVDYGVFGIFKIFSVQNNL